jgi:adenosylcobinamide kinase/adenosylcobinamide-phosphate guanylyltransferase
MQEAAKRFTLILGGARSGKSTLAEKLAQTRAGKTGKVLYVATLLPYDEEMRERVVLHRANRPESWRTLEAPYNLADQVLAALKGEDIVLLDCLTVWSANRLIAAMEPDLMRAKVIFEEELPDEPPARSGQAGAGDTGQNNQAVPPELKAVDYQALEHEMGAELERLLVGLQAAGMGLVLVSNEVGMGLVPPYPLGRAYRDLLGRLNQRLAGQADEVFFVMAGIPVDLKRLQAEFGL